MQVRPDLGRIEKWVLRKAFDDEEQPFLPKVVVVNLRSEPQTEFFVVNIWTFRHPNFVCHARTCFAAYPVQTEGAVQ